MGAFIEQPEVIGGHLEAVWRPFGGCLEAKEAYRGPLAACLGCLTKAASPKLLKLNNHLLINVLNLICLKPFTVSVHCLPARSTGPLLFSLLRQGNLLLHLADPNRLSLSSTRFAIRPV